MDMPDRHRNTIVLALSAAIAAAVVCLAPRPVAAEQGAEGDRSNAESTAPRAAPPDAGAQAPTKAAQGSDPSESAAAPTRAPGRSHVHPSPAQILDQRVRALTKELDLDTQQQAGVRRVLIQERMAVLGLRKGNANGAQDVVAASQAILVRTRDEIRSLLNDEQRKKYTVEVPQDKLAPAQADVTHWLQATQVKPRPANAAPDTQATPAAGAVAPTQPH
jgi:hypothetical protein